MLDALALEGLDIASLMPHQGAMCLWQHVVAADADSVTVSTTTHRDLNHVLRSQGQLRALHLCEYGAQAMAVHGGLLARVSSTPVRPGFLVALRGMRLHVQRIDDLPGALIGHATLLMQAEDSQQYAFRIEHDGRLLAEGRAAVMLQAQSPR